MKNILEFDQGYKALISYDSEIEMFRGEFVGLSGNADFYAKDIEGLKEEGKISLRVFLELCQEKGLSPKKKDGKFALCLAPELYELVYAKAKSNNMSINAYISDTLREAVYS